MIIYSTYCSAEKNKDSSKIPAIDRYISSRIEMVSKIAQSTNHEFFILSGLYGLIHSKKLIPYYDHLLSEEEIVKHTKLVSEQLKEFGITEILFYTRPLSTDPKIRSYLMCINQACEESGIKLTIAHI